MSLKSKNGLSNKISRFSVSNPKKYPPFLFTNTNVFSSGGSSSTPSPSPSAGAFSNAFSNAFNI